MFDHRKVDHPADACTVEEASRIRGTPRRLRRKRVLGMADVELIKQMLEQYTQEVLGETVAYK